MRAFLKTHANFILEFKQIPNLVNVCFLFLINSIHLHILHIPLLTKVEVRDMVPPGPTAVSGIIMPDSCLESKVMKERQGDV